MIVNALFFNSKMACKMTDFLTSLQILDRCQMGTVTFSKYLICLKTQKPSGCKRVLEII